MTTRAPAIQKAGDVRTREAKPPDGCDDVPITLFPAIPPPKKLPRRPEPFPTNDVSRLITYAFHFYLRNRSSKSTAPPAHTPGDFMRSTTTVEVPPPAT